MDNSKATLKVISEVRVQLLEGGAIQVGLPNDSVLALGLLQFGIYQVHDNIRKASQEANTRALIAEASTIAGNGSSHLKGV